MNSNNPFETFEIEHLSASSVNTYIADPCMWILRYLYNYKSPSNPAMWRGTVVDEGIGSFLGFYKNEDGEWVKKKTKTTPTKVVENALKQFQGLYNFHKKTTDIDKSKYEREKNFVPKYLNVAMPYYARLGTPVFYQKKISLQLDEIPIPIIGYIDLQYEGVVRDIKTVSRLPSAIPDTVNRQLSIYALCEKSTPIVDYVYVTSSKAEVITMFVEDVEEHIGVVKRVASSIMDLLSYSNDVNQIAKLFYPNFDDWRWSEGEIKVAKEIWSIK